MDRARAASHADLIHKECEKGYFQDFKEDLVVDYLLAGPPEEAALTAELYEQKYCGPCGEKACRTSMPRILVVAASLRSTIHVVAAASTRSTDNPRRGRGLDAIHR